MIRIRISYFAKNFFAHTLLLDSPSRVSSRFSFLVCSLCLSNSIALAQHDNQAVKASIDRAVTYLVSQQKKDDSIADRSHPTAITSLAVMAMASTGIMPTDPTPAGRAINRALDYVLLEKHQDEQGYFGAADGSRMYGHGIITLMMTELSGMAATPEQAGALHEQCQAGLNLIIASQRVPKSFDFQGGWRYTPDSRDSDLSVSVWQLLALRSAANDQFDVPPESIAAAVEYLERSFTSPLDAEGSSQKTEAGFGYMPGYGNPTFAMTAAGTLAMQICGNYESKLLNASRTWLQANPPKKEDRFFCYGVYYYAQAMHQSGETYADEAQANVERLLLSLQKPDGSWESPSGEERVGGDVYATAMAILSLSVRYHYLPIYQR